MSEGFKGFTKKDDKYTLNLDINEVGKLIKEYKRLKKLQKSNMFQVSKMSGRKTEIDKLIEKHGIDPEAIE
tara:strand:+ start:2158 stop:2370 length:213 start_codon:yes stop_codon:yes gene_type:complete